MAPLVNVRKWASSAIPSVVRRTYIDFSEDRIPAVAAGATFFMLLALFPALASVVSLCGLFADRVSIGHVVDALKPYFPGGAITVLGSELNRLLLEKPAKLNVTFYGGLAVALWSASGGIKALIDGLNVAFDTSETRSFPKLTRNALLFTAAAILLSVGAVYVTVVLPTTMGRFAFARVLAPLSTILRWPAAFLVVAVMFGLVYRIGPNRRAVRPAWITWGSAIGAVLWILGTLAFSSYVQNFGSYDRVYGNLGAAVGFLTWIWISLMILLGGAELDREIERDRNHDPRRSP
jgi:membrane protein